jgi:hypothetical protein
MTLFQSNNVGSRVCWTISTVRCCCRKCSSNWGWQGRRREGECVVEELQQQSRAGRKKKNNKKVNASSFSHVDSFPSHASSTWSRVNFPHAHSVCLSSLLRARYTFRTSQFCGNPRLIACLSIKVTNAMCFVSETTKQIACSCLLSRPVVFFMQGSACVVLVPWRHNGGGHCTVENIQGASKSQRKDSYRTVQQQPEVANREAPCPHPCAHHSCQM